MKLMPVGALLLFAVACSSSKSARRDDGSVIDSGTADGSGAVSSRPDTSPTPDPTGSGPVYHVGPGQTYSAIGDVPWYSLQAGSTVYIHYRTDPYREKFLISTRGTASEWIRVLGVPGPSGQLPVISGDAATTSSNNHYRWQNPQDIQFSGVVQIAVHDGGPIPGYIEIANLQVQDARNSQHFTAENGQSATYENFAACIYARSPQHLLVHNCVMTNCGQGFYNWTGDGRTTDPPSGQWWDGLAMDITLRQNYFYNNGVGYTEHQSYTEALGVVIEGNHYGTMHEGALGNQIKDRSAGTIVRYNYVEASSAAWHLDLVEPEESAATTSVSPLYGQDFVYGNVFITSPLPSEWDNFIHWNEDHYVGTIGRAISADHRLFLYHNTFVVKADRSDASTFHLVNANYGGWECPSEPLQGRIDLRNNIIALLPRTAGKSSPALELGFCRERFDLSNNWISPGWTHSRVADLTGAESTASPASNDPAFSGVASGDVSLAEAPGVLGGPLAPQVTSNAYGQDLTPVRQYHFPHTLPTPTWNDRVKSGAGSDPGAIGR